METTIERATDSARDRLAREAGWEGFETDRFVFPTAPPAGKSLSRRGIEIGILVVVLLVAKSRLLPGGDVEIVINDDPDKTLKTSAGGTLLGGLAIFQESGGQRPIPFSRLNSPARTPPVNASSIPLRI